MLSPKVDSLKKISFGKEGLTAELEVLKKRTSENERAIVELILGSMGADAYRNLRKLAPPPIGTEPSGKFGRYTKEPHMGLETELYHLRNLGYVVENREKTHSIHDIPVSGDQLSDYVTITQAGIKYIELREKRAKGQALA